MSEISTYKHPAQKGTPYTKMLPKGSALVLEGGGVRGFYSAGVFEAFMDEGLMFPYIIGVSAGTANALTYLAGQKKRNRFIVENYIGDSRYISYRNFLKHGSFFGYDFIFKTIPDEYVFWDRELAAQNEARFLTGVTNCETGKAMWYEKQDVLNDISVTIASCSVPFAAKIVNYKGLKLMDGGIASPIPIDKSAKDGNTFHVIVLTRNKGYIKEPAKAKRLINMVYGKYPAFAQALLNRHEIYTAQLKMCEELEAEGKAVIIRPIIPLSVSRNCNDAGKLLTLYDEGHNEGLEAIKKISMI
ncbi:MAG: patatin family protein [Clostridiales bacterium]|jgi:predicted patatin/cPLA2 family phospholipase|nr:patatin family protein [Clostridiales bacterium]